MKKLLAGTALALMATTGAAMADALHWKRRSIPEVKAVALAAGVELRL